MNTEILLAINLRHLQKYRRGNLDGEISSEAKSTTLDAYRQKQPLDHTLIQNSEHFEMNWNPMHDESTLNRVRSIQQLPGMTIEVVDERGKDMLASGSRFFDLEKLPFWIVSKLNTD